MNYTKQDITTSYFDRNEVLLTIVMNSKQHRITTWCCFEFTENNMMNSVKLVRTNVAYTKN